MARFSVRVYRYITEEYADIEVSGKSKADAEAKAVKEAERSPHLFDTPEIYYAPSDMDETERLT